MQSGDKNTSKPKPLVINFTRDITNQRPRGFQPFTTKTPTPFPYKSDKAIPWKYSVQGSTKGRMYLSYVLGMTCYLLRLQIFLVRVA